MLSQCSVRARALPLTVPPNAGNIRLDLNVRQHVPFVGPRGRVQRNRITAPLPQHMTGDVCDDGSDLWVGRAQKEDKLPAARAAEDAGASLVDCGVRCEPGQRRLEVLEGLQVQPGGAPFDLGGQFGGYRREIRGGVPLARLDRVVSLD